jgi:hypothetical protein
MTEHEEIIDVDGEETAPTVAALAPIVPGDALVRAAASVADVEQAFHDYQRLCAVLLDDDDVQRIQGRTFRKKSAWRKLAVAFGVSCEVLERIYDRDETGKIIRAEIVVRAYAPNGRHMDGLGICDVSERRFSKPQHDVPATAMTRATNRACADLFGMGEVSAEEILDDAPEHRSRSKRAAPVAPVAPVPNVDAEFTEKIVTLLRALPENYREQFKAWRREQGIGWPIASSDVANVGAQVDAIIRQAEKDLEPF